MLSNTKDNFKPAPDKYAIMIDLNYYSFVRARPLRDKATLMATNYKVNKMFLLNC